MKNFEIKESESTISQLLKAASNPNKKIRLEALLLKKQNPSWSYSRLAEEMNIHRRTVSRWFDSYLDGGVRKMLSVQRMGSRLRKTLDDKQQADLRSAIEKGEIKSYQDARFWILKEANIALEYKNACMFVNKQMGISLKALA